MSPVYHYKKNLGSEGKGRKTMLSRSDVLGEAGDNGGSAVRNTSLGN